MLEANGRERRRYQRIQLSVPARYLAEDGTERHATLLDVSAGGLALTTQDRPKVGLRLVVYVDEIGRVEGRVVRHIAQGFAIEFEATDSKRQRLLAKLEWLAQPRAGDPPPPLAPNSEKPRFVLGDGREIECRVLDISVEEVRLKVKVRPEIGEEVTIGRMRGRICRHHPDGVAIELLRSAH